MSGMWRCITVPLPLLTEFQSALCMLDFGKSQHAALEEMTLQVPLRNPPTPSWIHDFPVTQHYAVLPEMPVIFNLKVSSPL